MYTFGNEGNALWLDDQTPKDVAAALYCAYRCGARVRIWYGDAQTGHAWLEDYNVVGRIGRSTGPRHIPILLHNGRSNGGGSILDHCIVKVQATVSRKVLYEHPTFSRGHFRIGGEMDLWVASRAPHLKVPVYHYHTGDADGWQNVANFQDWDRAVRWVDFMTGARMSTGGCLARDQRLNDATD